MLKRFTPQIALLTVICIIAVLGCLKPKVIDTGAVPETEYSVILDAGHGGFDGGASASDGTVEKDINLQIAVKAAQMLRLNGINVIMTRIEDTGTEDDETAEVAKRKKSDLYNRLQLMKDNPDAVL